MTKNIKIYGAGSIGNHLAYSSSILKNNIEIVDKDPNALRRMMNNIYPSRYGKWNNKIKLTLLENDKNFTHDYYFIGTPPDSRYLILKKILNSKTKPIGILIEKPITIASTKHIKDLKKIIGLLNKRKIMVFCGYNHSVSLSFINFVKLIKILKTNKVLSIESNWNETTKGILEAHSWLKNIYSSYLGNKNKGGGSLHEHSHGLHLFIYITYLLNLNLIGRKKSIQILKKNGLKKHDFISNLQIYSQDNIFYKINTDFYTSPAQKNIKIQYENQRIELHFSTLKNQDEIHFYKNGNFDKKIFKKTRKDDFTMEIKHILDIKNTTQYNQSPLNYKFGLNVVEFINKYFR